MIFDGKYMQLICIIYIIIYLIYIYIHTFVSSAGVEAVSFAWECHDSEFMDWESLSAIQNEYLLDSDSACLRLGDESLAKNVVGPDGSMKVLAF